MIFGSEASSWPEVGDNPPDEPPVALDMEDDDEETRLRLIGEILASLLWSFNNA